MTDSSSTVAVGVDGSSSGQYALRWAIEEARLRGAGLRVLHAWSPPAPISGIGSIISPIDPTEFEQCAKQVLADEVASAFAQAAPSMHVESVLVRGYPPEALLARSKDAGLLVVGSRGRGGFKGLLLGSVSQHCASHAPVPVTVVREGVRMPDSADVVVGVDGSVGSQAALQAGFAEAHARAARLVVAHAWWVDFPIRPMDALPVVSIDPAPYMAHSRELMHEMVDTARRQTAAQPADIDFVSVGESPSRGLLSLTKNAGLLVLGTRGRGGFTGLLLGSVSQQCLHHAQCAVMVVPAPAP